jgi:hypothetical protein
MKTFQARLLFPVHSITVPKILLLHMLPCILSVVVLVFLQVLRLSAAFMSLHTTGQVNRIAVCL